MNLVPALAEQGTKKEPANMRERCRILVRIGGEGCLSGGVEGA